MPLPFRFCSVAEYKDSFNILLTLTLFRPIKLYIMLSVINIMRERIMFRIHENQ